MSFLSSIFGGGTVQATPQEQMLATNMLNGWRDYQARWLPTQQHFSNVVNDMANPDAWQRQEATGKATGDVSIAMDATMKRQSAELSSRGIRPGSAAFNMSVAGGSTAEAVMKGTATVQANELIDKAYTENLNSIIKEGSQLRQTATQGMGISAEVASREAITNAQITNANRSAIMGAVGFGLNTLSQPETQTGISNLFSGGGNTGTAPGMNLGATNFSGGGYQPGLDFTGSGSFPGSQVTGVSPYGGVIR